MTVLSLDGVAKRYVRGDREIVALDGVSVDLAKGDFVAVSGRSRSGKTTLLRIAAGIEVPDAGSVRFDGEELATLSRKRRARLLLEEIGCVWQGGRITHGLSVRDHVALPLLKSQSHSQARRRANAMLERVGAQGCARAQWHELSDGDRTRVALAHALVRAPRLLLADEPTVNLNMLEREQLVGLLRSVAQDGGVTVLMTAPDAPATVHSNRTMSIDAGRLIKPTSERRRSPEGPGAVIPFPAAGERRSDRSA